MEGSISPKICSVNWIQPSFSLQILKSTYFCFLLGVKRSIMVALFSAMSFFPCWGAGLGIGFSLAKCVSLTSLWWTVHTQLGKIRHTQHEEILLKFELASCLQRKSALTIFWEPTLENMGSWIWDACCYHLHAMDSVIAVKYLTITPSLFLAQLFPEIQLPGWY